MALGFFMRTAKTLISLGICLSLCWAHRSFCWFCHVLAYLLLHSRQRCYVKTNIQRYEKKKKYGTLMKDESHPVKTELSMCAWKSYTTLSMCAWKLYTELSMCAWKPYTELSMCAWKPYTELSMCAWKPHTELSVCMETIHWTFYVCMETINWTFYVCMETTHWTFCVHGNHALNFLCVHGNHKLNFLCVHGNHTDYLFEIRKIAVCFLWLSLPGDCRVTDEALLAETT